MAAVCLSVCAVTVLALNDRLWAEAAFTCCARRFSTASRLSRPPVRFGNSGWAGSPASFGEPGAQDGDGDWAERGDPLLASLAMAGDVRPGAEVDVAAGECGQLGDPQPGLGGEREHGVIAPSGPGALVRGGEERTDFGFGEPGDERLVESLGGDGQDAGDGLGVLGVAQGRVGEHGADRGEAGVAGAGAVAPVVLEMVQEVSDQRRVQVADVEITGLLAGALRGERQEQPPGVAVGGDRLRASVPLPG
jgi:hypothetical protein